MPKVHRRQGFLRQRPRFTAYSGVYNLHGSNSQRDTALIYIFLTVLELINIAASPPTEQSQQIAYPARIPPFVVVPVQYTYKAVLAHLRKSGVVNRGVGVTDDVG
jgi:hypothetical protein